MTTLNLGSFGVFLSGRSRAKEIVGPISMAPPLTLDFSGIEGVSQSFLSELFVSISEKKIHMKDLKFANISNPLLQGKVEAELKRVLEFLENSEDQD